MVSTPKASFSLSFFACAPVVHLPYRQPPSRQSEAKRASALLQEIKLFFLVFSKMIGGLKSEWRVCPQDSCSVSFNLLLRFKSQLKKLKLDFIFFNLELKY